MTDATVSKFGCLVLLTNPFGTNLYHETNDIYLVADVLGHKDVNTTRKHYAANSEDRRKVAAEVTRLRE